MNPHSDILVLQLEPEIPSWPVWFAGGKMARQWCGGAAAPPVGRPGCAAGARRDVCIPAAAPGVAGWQTGSRPRSSFPTQTTRPDTLIILPLRLATNTIAPLPSVSPPRLTYRH